MKRIFICSGLFLLLIMNLVNADTIIRWDKAHKYYEQPVTVDGKIVDTYNSGKACFLNFHPNYKKYFTAVIFKSAFSRFPSDPENFNYGKEVHVTGKITEYKGKPEIIVNDPSQIKILSAKSSSVYDYQYKYFHNKNYSAQERIYLKCAFMLLGYDLNCKSDEWDEKTDIAVRSFQFKNKLKQDGMVGPKTLSVLKDSILNKKNIYSKHKSFIYNVLSDIELRQNINKYKTKEKNISNH